MLNQSDKNALHIIIARGFSDFGAFLNMVALATYVYWLSNSAISVGIFMAARVTGGIVASTISSNFFKRFKGKYSLILFDILRALSLSSILFVPYHYQLYVLIPIAFFIGFGNAMFAIGLNTQIPNFVKRSKQVSVNAWITSISSTAAVLGSLISGVMVAICGYEVVFLINIATYVVAAILIIPLKFIEKPQIHQTDRLKLQRNQLVSLLKKNKMLVCLLLITMADTLGSAAHNVGFPILSKLISPQSASTTMGIILATWACGKFLGSRVANFFLKGKQQVSMERFFMLGVLAMSTGFILLFAQHTFTWLIPFAIWAGVGDGISEVCLISRIQSEPEQTRLPFFSLLTFSQNSGFGIGMLIVSPFFIWWSPAYVVLLFHGIPLAMLLYVSIRMHKTIFKFNTYSNDKIKVN
ncbi:MFS transporter [Thiotrichales bacterium 19S3-7]|nr:MFS transporter [Thiotrichales bacterium 19S3-7]MCF6803039.1 MFS transporter [Thiotrichales bacterium 19S3-11]